MAKTLLLWLFGLALVGCPAGRQYDDDDASDDDDSASDDDDMTVDDDDATSSPQSPTIDSVEVCQSTTLLGSFGLFEIEVSDAQDNLLAPLTYRVQVDAGSNVGFTWDFELGGHGWIDHSQAIGTAPLLRGTEHTWSFTVLDSTGNLSDPWEYVWTVPNDDQAEACGD
jgi:hypothetical protein